ncbi:MAG: RNA polymerase factor sigma-54 [Bacteroidales bacterium]|nr:RNA polymerase factor sigma-54 [Bacteroidales bacterium]
MLRQALEQKQIQKLSPQQIMTAKLIELPIQSLEQRVRQEMEENPVLEEDDSKESGENSREVSLSDYKEDDPIPSYRLRSDNYSKYDDRPKRETFSVQESFPQNLKEQLDFRDLTPHQRDIANYIIYSLDDDGYLRRDIDKLVDEMAFRAGIETTDEEVESLLKVIQTFEPAGVGARDLRECLLIQLNTLKDSPVVEDARKIIRDHFSEFTKKDFNRIMAQTGMTPERLKTAMARILKLNPTPGGQVSDAYSDHTQQVVPDFVLDVVDGEFVLTMPRFSVPEVKVNHKYADILMEASNSSERSKKEAATFVKKKLESAKWFVDALRQRHTTLMTTMQAILDYQRDYFRDGDETKIKPMILKDIADKTGYDISTVSRVANSKYIETHFGIFPLKYFFSESIKNQAGEDVSTRELKKILQEIIDGENKQKPLTDDEIVDMMNDKGYNVARRTIAKYRDQLGIPKSRMRREIL